MAAGCAAWTTFACVPRGSSRAEASADAGKGGSQADQTTVALASAGRDPTRRAAKDPALDEPWSDDFERTTLGEDWYAESAVWTVSGGQLCGRGARNHPVWLKRRLPVNARIEFDAISASPDGDIKVEAWGDGSSGATGVSYRNATSYLFIFGGWKNRFHVLARLDEHAPDRLQLVVDPQGTDPRTRPVIANTRYHFKIERADGHTVRWLIDDIEMIRFADPAPLVGTAHDHFAFNDWEVPVCFDRLVVTPLGS
ncbi:MAG: hypothetical protein JW940_23290 [Polyangiaceae bacterium]|nr:hypothetical protein [Polyangiaceae bacterium]